MDVKTKTKKKKGDFQIEKIETEVGYSIYNKTCPRCRKLNYDYVSICWNCEHEFAEQNPAPLEEKKDTSFILALIFMALVILTFLGISFYNLLLIDSL